jgi:hypothetical protein
MEDDKTTKGEFGKREKLLGTGEQLKAHIDEWYDGQDESNKDILKLHAEIGRILAERVGEGKVPEGYVMAIEQLMYDLQTGRDGLTGELMPSSVIGNPTPFYMNSKFFLIDFARGAFGDEYGDRVDEIYKSI